MPNLTIRATAAEIEEVDRKADLLGMNRTDYVRERLGLGPARPPGAPRGNRNNPGGRWGRDYLARIETLRTTTCGRCGSGEIDTQPDRCAYCQHALCYDCWEAKGHCGHPQQDAINAAART